jgi:hypothetical protein
VTKTNAKLFALGTRRYLQGVGRVEEEAGHPGLVSQGLDDLARLDAVHLQHRGRAGDQKTVGTRRKVRFGTKIQKIKNQE